MKFKKLMILFIFFAMNNKQYAADDFGFSEECGSGSKIMIYGSLAAFASMITIYFLRKNDVITWAWLDWVNKDGADIKEMKTDIIKIKEQLASKVVTSFKDAGASIKNVGASVVNTIADAGTSVVNTVADAGTSLKNAGASVVNTVADAASAATNVAPKK